MGMRIGRRALLTMPALVAAPIAPMALAQETAWPDRPVRVIVPNPPGGSTDVITRVLLEPLRRELGQTFVLENRPGAGGNVGTESVVRSPPDGSTILSATVTQYVSNGFLYRHLTFDALRDLAYSSMTSESANVAVISPGFVPATSFQGLIDWAKTQPPGISFTTPGAGTSAHLLGSLFGRVAGVEVQPVHFRGGGEAYATLLRGDAPFTIDNLATWRALIQAGRVRALAISSAQRSALLPDVPTFAEIGYPQFGLMSWSAFALPLATPRPILQKLADAMRRIAADPEVQRRVAEVGAQVVASTPEETVARLARERPIWGEMVRLSGASGD